MALNGRKAMSGPTILLNAQSRWTMLWVCKHCVQILGSGDFSTLDHPAETADLEVRKENKIVWGCVVGLE